MNVVGILKAIDLCAGAGGWACAARELPIRIVLAVDLWDRALKTYEINHPGVQTFLGDVRDKSTQRGIAAAGPFDLVLGGIPCEEISVWQNINKPVTQTKIDAWRATLSSCLGLVRRLNPRWWCLEDVPGIVKELPPKTPYLMIDSRDYSAQRRRRAYVGKFPKPKPRRCGDSAGAYLRTGPYRIGSRGWGKSIGRSKTFEKQLVQGLHPGEKCPTVCTWCSRKDHDVVVVDDRLPGGLRQVEWQEAARLQGFPEDYLFYGSPTDVAKMIGQAVQVDTGRAILEAIVEATWKSKR